MQSPEQIAKDYGGNKRKIAEAMQLGVVDPTAGTLAGMFIDRMRSAAQTEQAPQQTIAQQVFAPPAPPAPMGGVGAPPQMPPQGPPAGLGATPEAAAMPPQDMGPPPQDMGPPPQDMGPPPQDMPMEEAPMGMAEGGLTTLPLPDTMFDEPNDGSYADGGMVAFAGGGGMSNLYDDVEYFESGGKQSAVSPKGARGVMQLMPGTMKDPGFGVTPIRDDSEAENRRAGQEYLDAMFRRYGDQPTALAAYNWGPGNVDKWLQKGGDPKKLPAETKKYISNVMKGSEPPIRERDTRTAQGFTSSLNDISDLVDRRYGKTDEEKTNEEALLARAKEMASPEYAAKEAKDSLYGTLAAVGFRIAGSKAANLAEAFGEAASAELGTYVADKKERKQLKDKALNLMVANGAKNRKDAMERFNLALNIQQAQLGQQQFGQKLDLSERELQLNRDKLNAEIAAAKSTGMNVTATVFSMFNSGNPAMKAAAEEWIMLNNPPSGSGTDVAQRLKELREGRYGTESPATPEGGSGFKYLGTE